MYYKLLAGIMTLVITATMLTAVLTYRKESKVRMEAQAVYLQMHIHTFQRGFMPKGEGA